MQLTKQQQPSNLARRQWDPFGSLGGEFFRMSPFALLRAMTEEMDRAFTGVSPQRGGDPANWTPALEVREKDGNLVVCADLPGIDEKDVKVAIAEDMLTIEGERKQEHEETKGGAHRSERSYGRFYRTIRLPEGAEADKAKAAFKNGVLEVKMPLSEPKVNKRTIPIEGAAPKTVDKPKTPEKELTGAAR